VENKCVCFVGYFYTYFCVDNKKLTALIMLFPHTLTCHLLTWLPYFTVISIHI